jgi:hypothetical protein
MAETRSRFGLKSALALAAGTALLAACAPQPVTRTVTTEQTTTSVPRPVATTTTEVTRTPEPVRHRAVGARRPYRTDDVIEETTETVTPAPPVVSTTRSTTQTVSPR